MPTWVSSRRAEPAAVQRVPGPVAQLAAGWLLHSPLCRLDCLPLSPPHACFVDLHCMVACVRNAGVTGGLTALNALQIGLPASVSAPDLLC